MKRMLAAAGGAAVLLGAALGVGYAQSAPLAHVRKDELAVAARALGVADVKALRRELRGSTLSAVAQKHNVPPSTVADAIKADLSAKVSDRVNALMTRQFPAAKTTSSPEST